MLSRLVTFTLVALQLGTSFARPTAQSQGYGGPCDPQGVDPVTADYVNDEGGHVVPGPQFIGGAIVGGGVTTSLTETHSVSYTVTVGTSFTLDITSMLIRLRYGA